MRDPVLSRDERAFLQTARRAVLATIAPGGRPRLVPICFVIDPARPILYTPIDEKPKEATDAMQLARIRDLIADPRVSVLVDRWEETWVRLAWVRCLGSASLVEPGDVPERGAAIASLRSKYEQYATHQLEALPIIRIAIQQTTSWGAVGP